MVCQRGWFVLVILGLVVSPAAVLRAATPPERAVHRYLAVRISPDAAYIASIEGDSPKGGFLPDLRELVMRRASDKSETRVPLPCGHVSQCWPGSLAWRPDSKVLAFTLRTPGSHNYALYTVAAQGTGLTQVMDYNGTLRDLRFAPDGSLAVLAVESAPNEVCATEAGTAVAGDLDAPPTEQRIAVLEGRALR